MPDLDDDDQDLLVFDAVDDAPVTDADPQQIIMAGQRLNSCRCRIVGKFTERGTDAFAYDWVKSLELLASASRQLDRVGSHVSG